MPSARRHLAFRLRHTRTPSTIRNMVRNGVPERLALDVSGIKPRANFDRSNVSSDKDKRAALEAVSLPTSGEERW